MVPACNPGPEVVVAHVRSASAPEMVHGEVRLSAGHL
jgi:hypothetical protein